MKITEVLLLEIAPVSLRIAWLISRACRPTCESPISPSSSFLGTRAATESITITSTALDLISISVMCIASSPLPGWLTSSVSRSTPSFLAQLGSERVLGVDEGGDAAGLLGPGHDVQGQRGLAARFGAEDLDDAALGNALAAQGDIQRQAAGRNAFDLHGGADAQRHDRAFAELLFDLRQACFSDQY